MPEPYTLHNSLHTQAGPPMSTQLFLAVCCPVASPLLEPFSDASSLPEPFPAMCICAAQCRHSLLCSGVIVTHTLHATASIDNALLYGTGGLSKRCAISYLLLFRILRSRTLKKDEAFIYSHHFKQKKYCTEIS